MRQSLVLILLYADDLILMSTSPEGLQQHLDALASFCELRQLTVNLSKTKVVIFEARRSDWVSVTGCAWPNALLCIQSRHTKLWHKLPTRCIQGESTNCRVTAS